MRFKDSFLIAFNGLRANMTRSLLTILGIIIGVAAVITVMSVGQGAQSLILDQLVSLGSNNIFVEPGAWSERMERGSMMQTMIEETEIKTLKYEDALAIEKLDSVETTASLVFGAGRVVYQNESKKLSYLGITEGMVEILDAEIIMGRNLNSQDNKSMARIAVLGYKTYQDLFGDQDAVGKTIRIQKTNFRVVGVMEEKGPQTFMSTDDSVFLPLFTAQKLLLGGDHIRNIVVQVKDENLINQTIEDIRLLLRERHRIYNPEGDPAKDDFKVVSQKDAADILGNVTGILTILLSSVAAISLLVGGIGIMNIMLVSVTERTKEIGLRKAVGAQKGDILNQFLLESILLTVIGGILGIVLGAFFSLAASFVFGYFLGSSWGFLLPLSAVAMAIGVSFLVGLTFGIYPANKASRLSPIEALRYE